MLRSFSTPALAVALSVASLFWSSTAQAKDPADLFQEKIILSEYSFPPQFESNKKLVAHVKRVQSHEFWPVSKDGNWVIHYMAFLAKPMTQRRYLVQFFDITEKDAPILITENATFTSGDALRISYGDYDLSPEFFKPNRKILMLFTPGIDQPALAEVEFVLRPYDEARAKKLQEARAEKERQRKKALEDRKKNKNKNLKWAPPEW